MKSPLRYPGGKTRAIPFLLKHMPDGVTELCSPFVGGASFELYLAANGVKVYAYDTFQPLVDFWQCLLENPEALAEEIKRFHPLKRESFRMLQDDLAKRPNRFTQLERAAFLYVLNRSSFSGMILCGGMSPDHPRFTERQIEYVRNFRTKNLLVSNVPFEVSIPRHTGKLKYLDPPYLIEQRLYGTGADQRGFDHQLLADILNEEGYFILSYNDCREVRWMYKDHTILKPTWKYGTGDNKDSREVLIIYKDIKAPRKTHYKLT